MSGSRGYVFLMVEQSEGLSHLLSCLCYRHVTGGVDDRRDGGSMPLTMSPLTLASTSLWAKVCRSVCVLNSSPLTSLHRASESPSRPPSDMSSAGQV